MLESVNPDILQRIDTEQHEIPISIGVPTQMRLAEISKLPDFDTYLAFKKTKKTMIGDGSSEGFIKELDENSFRVGYYIYPKDALRK